MPKLAVWLEVRDQGYVTRVAVSAQMAERIRCGDSVALYSLSIRATKSRGNREFGHTYNPNTMAVSELGPYRPRSNSRSKSQKKKAKPFVVGAYGICPRCGYDCRDQPGTDRCPNCGEKIIWPDDL